MKQYYTSILFLSLIACAKPNSKQPSSDNPVIPIIHSTDKTEILKQLKSQFCTIKSLMTIESLSDGSKVESGKTYLLASANAFRPSVYTLDSDNQIVSVTLEPNYISEATCDPLDISSKSHIYFLEPTKIYKSKDFSQTPHCEIAAGTTLNRGYTISGSSQGYKLELDELPELCNGLKKGYSVTSPATLYFIEQNDASWVPL